MYLIAGGRPLAERQGAVCGRSGVSRGSGSATVTPDPRQALRPLGIAR